MNTFRYIISELIFRISKTFYVDTFKIYFEIAFIPILGEGDKSTSIITFRNGRISNIFLFFGALSIVIPILDPGSKTQGQESSCLNNIIIFLSHAPISYGFFLGENTFTLDFYMYVDHNLLHTRIGFPLGKASSNFENNQKKSFDESNVSSKDDSIKQERQTNSSSENMNSTLTDKISTDHFLKLFQFITMYILYSSTKEKNKNEDDL